MMMDLFRHGDVMLKFNKKMLRNQGCVVATCLFLLFVNGYLMVHNSSLMSAAAFGAFICNTIWTLLFFLEQYSDYQIEKRNYSMIKEMEEQHKLEDNIRFLKEKQKQYDSMIAEFQKMKGV